MPNIGENAGNLMKAIFSSKQFRGYVSRISKEYHQRKKESASISAMDLDQVLAMHAVSEFAALGRDLTDLIKLVFPDPENEGYISGKQAISRILDGQRTFEVEYDEKGLPIAYKLHTEESFMHIDKQGRSHELMAGIQKGDFIGYKTIARWLKENR